MPRNLSVSKPKTLKVKDIKPAKGKGKQPRSKGIRVQEFAAFQPENEHKRLDEMIDQTIYIIKIEPNKSKKFGEGYKLWFKDLPNAKDTYTAACYGAYVVPTLDNLYHLSHDGKLISPEIPVKTTIREAGNTYKFE